MNHLSTNSGVVYPYKPNKYTTFRYHLKLDYSLEYKTFDFRHLFFSNPNDYYLIIVATYAS